MELKDLKKNYEELVKRHKIPSFKELNEEFEIDRIERESDCPLRSVRKAMMDKIVKYIQFVEMLLNPAQAPPMFMMFVKNVNEKDKKSLEKIYENFIKLELSSLRLEIDYNEKNEALLVKKISETWGRSKLELRLVIEMMERNWNKSSPGRADRGYLG